MIIRMAEKSDIPDIEKLLRQICMVHYEGRPDLFKPYKQKYYRNDLEEMLDNDNMPLFVAVEGCRVLGYALCQVEIVKDDNVCVDRKTLYLDDLCVDENIRGGGIGKKILEHIERYAKKSGFNDLTLNVWECNEKARKFYDRMGYAPVKTKMEKILK